MKDRIESQLRQAFAPEALEVVDESEQHRGHAGYQEGGESHFRVKIRAAALKPMGRLERHRAIHAALGKDVLGSIHALALEVEA